MKRYHTLVYNKKTQIFIIDRQIGKSIKTRTYKASNKAYLLFSLMSRMSLHWAENSKLIMVSIKQ